MDDAMMAMTRGIDPDIVEALIDYGRELKIADLTAEAAKWQRLYLEAVSELAQMRCDNVDTELLTLAIMAVMGNGVSCSANLPPGLRELDYYTANQYSDDVWLKCFCEAEQRLDLAATVPQGD